MRIYTATLLLIASVVLAACSPAPAAIEVPSAAALGAAGFAPRTLYDRTDLDDLAQVFNDDAGQPRIVLLLSPT